MDNIKVLKNALVDGKITDIVVVNGKIANIGKTEAVGDIIDIKGERLLPGLIDVHSHGCIGYDTMDATPIQMREMRSFMKKNGTTTWFPTTMANPIENIDRVTSQDFINSGEHCCNVPGFHMEGPYINPKYKGAMLIEHIKSPSLEEFKALKGIKMVTVAPELEGSDALICYCAENDIIVSLGHTDCDFACALKAFKLGAKCLTHTFNAMPPLLHRSPGPIGAALVADAYVQVICDGEHIHPAAILALYKMFGSDRMVLISDSIQATGLGDGAYSFGGLNIIVKGGVSRTMSGALSGSTTTLFGCVKKAIDFGIPEAEAFKMASETPGKLMGLKKGRIEIGYDADFIILDDRNDLIDTIVLS